MILSEITSVQARDIIASWQSQKDQINLAFLHGDHWQNGDAWIGPLPDEGDASSLARLPSLIEREFVFNDVLGEIVWRGATAVTARPPRYGATLTRVLAQGEEPSDDERERIDEMDALAAAWLSDSRRFIWTDENSRLQTCDLKGFLYRVALQLGASRMAVIRMMIPPAETVEIVTEVMTLGGDVLESNSVRELPALPLPEALDRIYFELCPFESACVHTTRHSMAQIGLVQWTDEIGQQWVECSFLDGGETVLRVMGRENDDEARFDLGGALMHLQLFSKGLLKPSLVSQQKDINRRLTMSGRSSNLAGFPEHVLLNAELQTIEVPDLTAPGGVREVPLPVRVGAGTLNNFVGDIIEDDKGEFLAARNVDYKRLDPIDTTMFDQSVASARQRMLGEAHQSYALMAGDASASGISRETAQAEFRFSIQSIADEITRSLIWICNTGFALALQTSSDNASDYDGFVFTGETVIYEGARSPDARAQDRQDVEAGMLSLETKMARESIDDIDAERRRIAGERTPDGALQVGTLGDRITLSKSLHDAGVANETIWRLVWGFDEATIAQMKAAEQSAQPSQIIL